MIELCFRSDRKQKDAVVFICDEDVIWWINGGFDAVYKNLTNCLLSVLFMQQQLLILFLLPLLPLLMILCRDSLFLHLPRILCVEGYKRMNEWMSEWLCGNNMCFVFFEQKFALNSIFIIVRVELISCYSFDKCEVKLWVITYCTIQSKRMGNRVYKSDKKKKEKEQKCNEINSIIKLDPCVSICTHIIKVIFREEKTTKNGYTNNKKHRSIYLMLLCGWFLGNIFQINHLQNDQFIFNFLWNLQPNGTLAIYFKKTTYSFFWLEIFCTICYVNIRKNELHLFQLRTNIFE